MHGSTSQSTSSSSSGQSTPSPRSRTHDPGHDRRYGWFMTIEQALRRFEERKKSYLGDLEKLVRIPSVSFPGFEPKEVRASAEATAKLLKERGFDDVQLLEIEGAH